IPKSSMPDRMQNRVRPRRQPAPVVRATESCEIYHFIPSSYHFCSWFIDLRVSHCEHERRLSRLWLPAQLYTCGPTTRVTARHPGEDYEKTEQNCGGILCAWVGHGRSHTGAGANLHHTPQLQRNHRGKLP